MKKILLAALSLLLTINIASAQNFTTVADGDWTTPATWGNSGSPAVPGVDYPSAGDNVTIAHSVNYNLPGGDSTFYNQLTIQGGGSSELKIPGNIGLGNRTVLGVNNTLNLSGPLNIGTKTLVDVHGDLNINSGSGITFTDRTSMLRSSTSSAQVQINDNVTIKNGIFSLKANGNLSFTLNGGSTFTLGAKSSLYLEGSSSSFQINGDIIVKDSAQVVANLNANLSVNVNGSLTFEYGSSFFQGEGTNKLTLTGNTPLWKIELSNTPGWRHISSPFASTFTFADLQGTDFNANLNTGQENIYWWNADGGGTGNNAPGWTTPTSINQTFQASADGYIIYTGDANYPFTNGGTVDINHQSEYNSSYSYTLHNSIDTATDGTHEGDQGWNLVGNPYSTWLNLDSILGEEMDGEYQGAHIWNTQAGQYEAYLANNETIENSHDNTGSSLGTAATRYIRPFQAFWLKMSSTSSSGASKVIEIKHTHRSFNPIAHPPSYFSTSFIPRLRLNAYAASDSAWDQVLVALNPTSSKLRLGNEDAFDRASNNDRPNMALIYEDGERLCIDSRPLDSATVIPMIFEQGVDGETYYIGMVDDQFDPSMRAFLEDLKTNTLHDLKNGAYSFVLDKGYTATRFNIHLAPNFVSQSEIKLAGNNFQVWTANDKVFVQLDKAGLHQNITVEVFDISGKLVFEASARAENTSLNIPLQMQTGAHIIKVGHPQYGSKVLKTIR